MVQETYLLNPIKLSFLSLSKILHTNTEYYKNVEHADNGIASIRHIPINSY